MGKALLHELGKSISFGRLSLLGKVLWPMLLSASDDQGRGLAETDVIKWYVCPNVCELTADTIPGALSEMEAQGMIHLYADARGRHLYQVLRWWEYQQLAWARPSKYEPPEGWADRIRYQHKGSITKENWEADGGYKSDELPSQLPSQLPTEQGSGINQLNSTKHTDADASAQAPATFAEWQAVLESAANDRDRNAILMRMFATLYPGRKAPTYGKLGKFANECGGHGVLAYWLFRASADPPKDDILAYCLAAQQKRAGSNGRDGPPRDVGADVDAVMSEMGRVGRHGTPEFADPYLRGVASALNWYELGGMYENAARAAVKDAWFQARGQHG